MKPRGTLARLSVLEAQAQQRAAQVEACKDRQIEAAFSRLSEADLKTLEDWEQARELGGERWEAACHAAQALNWPSDHPAKGAADQWAQALNVTPNGTPYSLPAEPEVFAGYFGDEARRGDELRLSLEAGAALPEGVDRAAAVRVVGWYAASCRFDAALAGVLGTPDGGRPAEYPYQGRRGEQAP
ncbi:hypothetical protein [Deinococcus sp.]|uniref:hypothetical protein n=1 Tax=Deinococcus sp. TaxID=47478 RepID=UPI0025E9D30E|nr:hypothetical protein [Deinococcus sp.]